MGLLTVINDEGHFQAEMASAGVKLVVVDFTASWCGPCQMIAPFFESLPTKFPNAIFLKVDVDKCAETAAAQGVTAMPTFIFYRNGVKVGRHQGADKHALETKIQQLYGSGDSQQDECAVPGHMDLFTFIMSNSSECLNDSDDHPMADGLKKGDGHMASDCDPQIIMNIAFNQAVKIHSLTINAPAESGPRNIRLFINQPRMLDFDSADSFQAVQELELSPKDLEGKPINLRYVKFQNVQNIQLFIKDNQKDKDVTVIEHLAFIGSPISTTNMSEFKRVAGKKGESH
uniref:Putative thioredoxin-like protein 1 n=1 Tax=Xenopsylla cheopis TaxID=163159 RepID=A0A6M2DJC1_XENCH